VGEESPAKNMRRLMTFAVHSQASSVLSRMPMTAFDRRAIAAGNDAWRAFSALPTCDELTMEGHDFTAALRFHLLLPQLLRTAEAPVVLDRDLDLPRLLRPEDVAAPRPSPPDLSYEAAPCRRCRDAACDRHLIHGHACASSKGKIGTRHDFVRDARFAMLKEIFSEDAGDVSRETRTCRMRDQCRADVMWKDRSNHSRQVHYFTDDTGGHPFAPSHFPAEQKNPIGMATMCKLVSGKVAAYAVKLAPLRMSPAVLAGAVQVIYWTCAFTSLGDIHPDFDHGSRG